MVHLLRLGKSHCIKLLRQKYLQYQGVGRYREGLGFKNRKDRHGA